MQPLNAVDRELAEIKKARSTDFQAYRKDQAMHDRELELLRQRDTLAGEVKTLEGLAAVAAPVLETAADRAAFEVEFDGMYEALPEAGQEAMRAILGGEFIEPTKPASEAQVEAFANSDIGAWSVNGATARLRSWPTCAPRSTRWRCAAAT